MKTLRLIFSDQLSHSIASLTKIQKEDVIFLCEVMEEAIYVKHHPKKIAFLFASMRHFAAELESRGCQVRYVKLDDASNTHTLNNEIARAVKSLEIKRIVVTEPSEYRLKLMVNAWLALLGLPVEIHPDNRFLCSAEEFKIWAKGKKQLRMEYFYREMRKKYLILMELSGFPVSV